MVKKFIKMLVNKLAKDEKIHDHVQFFFYFINSSPKNTTTHKFKKIKPLIKLRNFFFFSATKLRDRKGILEKLDTCEFLDLVRLHNSSDLGCIGHQLPNLVKLVILLLLLLQPNKPSLLDIPTLQNVFQWKEPIGQAHLFQ